MKQEVMVAPRKLTLLVTHALHCWNVDHTVSSLCSYWCRCRLHFDCHSRSQGRFLAAGATVLTDAFRSGRLQYSTERVQSMSLADIRYLSELRFLQ